MNRKAVKGTIGAKFKSFLSSIEDEKLRKEVERNTIFTGGCIASMLLGEEVKDFDIYFTNYQTTLNVAHYYTKQFNATHDNKAYVQIGTGEGLETFLDGVAVEKFAGGDGKTDKKSLPKGRIRIFIKSLGVAGEVPLEQPFEDVFDKDELPKETTDEKPKYRPVFLSSNAITLSEKFQLIIRFYGNPETIHENFDFVHATNYYTTRDKQLYTNVEALESLMSKNLRYVGSKYPLCSVIRTRKFINRGYHINAGQYLKMMMQINELDLTNVDTLEEQLVGVDSTYFTMMITNIREKMSNDPDFKLDTDYVLSIIEKIF